jgi:hypothetical protein
LEPLLSRSSRAELQASSSKEKDLCGCGPTSFHGKSKLEVQKYHPLATMAVTAAAGYNWNLVDSAGYKDVPV